MENHNQKKGNVVIVGGGNAAHVFIARCGHLGIPCDWLTTLPDEARQLKEVTGNDSGVTAINTINGENWFGKPERISHNPAEIIPGADLIILTMPNFAQEPTLKIIGPYVKEGTSIGAIPGGAAFDVLIYEILGKDKARTCTFFGTRTLPWSCRIREYGKTVSILGFKDKDQIVVHPSTNTSVVDRIERIVGHNHKYEQVSNFLFLSFTMPWHPCFMYGMFGEWDGITPFKGQPEFYSSVSQKTADLISDTSDEIIGLRNEIAKHFPSINLEIVMHAKEWMKMAYGSSFRNSDLNDLRNMIAKNPAYKGLLFPMKPVKGGYIPDFMSRYLTEDIPCIFLVYKGLAEMIGFQIPKTEMIIEWSQRVMGKEYMVNSRLLGRDLRETRAPQRFGFKDFEDFARTMSYI